MTTMHGTIMVFLAVVPLGFGAFGNFVMPLQIGAPDMAFPKLNMMSYWLYFVGGVMMFGSFFLETGATKGGWTFYPPLATIDDMFVANPWMTGQVWWLLAMVFMITSSLLGSVNVITTIINLRAKGMTWFRLPFFVWGMLVTAFLLLLAFPPLEVAALMQLSDRVFGSSFFMPTGLQVQGQVLDYSGGGSPCSTSTCSGSSATPRSTSCSCRASRSSPKSSPTTPASRCGATNRWSMACWCSGSSASSSGPTTCTSPAWARRFRHSSRRPPC
jgi:heme/copper-type cytochrome/quinol oxidase subunit 1